MKRHGVRGAACWLPPRPLRWELDRATLWERPGQGQAGNGIVLPLTLVLLLLVVNRERIMGPFRNSRLANALGALVVLVISGLSVRQLLRVLGILE